MATTRTADTEIAQHGRTVKDAAALAFIGFLVAIAYQNASGPAGSVLEAGKAEFADVAMFISFAVFGLGVFLLGAFNLAFARTRGWGWILNFLVLVLEGTILVFIGQVVTTRASSSATIGFPILVLALLIVDAAWNLVTSILHSTAQDTWRYTLTAVLSAVLVGVCLTVFRANSDIQLALISAVLVASFFIQDALVISQTIV